jgi:DNA-binding response OmpR family regulator
MTPVQGPENALRSILVVEDDAEIAAALADALTDVGFDVSVANDGAEALEMITARPPALALIDLMMPRMSGWQLISEIRGRPELAGVSLFVITAARNVGTVPTGIPVFVKPLKLGPFIDSIQRLMSGHRHGGSPASS